jgi:hypothetical protein
MKGMFIASHQQNKEYENVRRTFCVGGMSEFPWGLILCIFQIKDVLVFVLFDTNIIAIGLLVCSAPLF